MNRTGLISKLQAAIDAMNGLMDALTDDSYVLRTFEVKKTQRRVARSRKALCKPEEDAVSDWAAMNLERGNGRVARKILYAHFVAWWDGRQNYGDAWINIDSRRFYEYLDGLGYQRLKSNGENYFKDVRLL